MKVGGIALRVDGALRFIPASVAVKVAAAPRVARVAGTPEDLLGIALHEGAIMPVLSIGEARDCMVVCDHRGELLGLVGGTVVRTGMFDVVGARADCVSVDGDEAKLLDVASIYARVQARADAGRWGG